VLPRLLQPSCHGHRFCRQPCSFASIAMDVRPDCLVLVECIEISLNQEHLAKDVSKLYTECFQPIKVPPRNPIKSQGDASEMTTYVMTENPEGKREWTNNKLLYLEQLRRGQAVLFIPPAASHAAPKRESACFGRYQMEAPFGSTWQKILEDRKQHYRTGSDFVCSVDMHRLVKIPHITYDVSGSVNTAFPDDGLSSDMLSATASLNPQACVMCALMDCSRHVVAFFVCRRCHIQIRTEMKVMFGLWMPIRFNMNLFRTDNQLNLPKCATVQQSLALCLTRQPTCNTNFLPISMRRFIFRCISNPQ